MENKHSETGMAEDILRSITQLSCSEVHLKTLIEKAISEIENGMVAEDDINSHLEKINSMKDELELTAQLRRQEMLYLYDLFKGNKTYWCMIKHLAVASYTAFEAYQASDDDGDLFEFAIDANKLFITACSNFLGLEIEPCASCFSDALKGDKE